MAKSNDNYMIRFTMDCACFPGDEMRMAKLLKQLDILTEGLVEYEYFGNNPQVIENIFNEYKKLKEGADASYS